MTSSRPGGGHLLAKSPMHSMTLSIILLTIGVFFGQCYGQQTWTLNEPGKSYLAFSPSLIDGSDQFYGLSFRTRQANGLLFHHHIMDLEVSGLPLKGYEFFCELREGKLHTGFVVNDYKDSSTVGIALDDDQWHSVEVRIDASKKEMRVTLDGTIQTETLKAYLWGNAMDLLLWSHVRTLFSIGGSKLKEWKDSSPFVGCIRDVEYVPSGGSSLPVSFSVEEGVASGCIDRCQMESTCNLGRCVNLYTAVKCDCYGTDYEGEYCEIESATSLTFRGYEWLTFQLNEQSNHKLFADHSRISLEFKTERGSGVLFYAVGGAPFHSHVTVSIYSGEVHASLSFEEDDVSFSEGIGLDDGRWHNLTIDHRKDVVTFYLDGKSTVKRVSKGGNYLNLDPNAYIGGGDNFVQTKGLPITRSFVGCMRNVYINDMSVLYELSTTGARTRYNGGASPQFGCHHVDEVPISFPRSSSMLKWSGRSREHKLSVGFKMRTHSTTAIVMFVELISRMDTASGLDFGSIQLWIVNRVAVLQFVPVTRDEESRENITLPAIISDGTVHDIEVTLINSKVTLTVDGNSVSSRRYNKILEYSGQVILGYSLRHIESHHGFVGCMHRIKIQGQRLDPIALIESNAAVGLLLDGCQLMDHCADNNICEHNSECYSDWDGVHCQCHHQNYEGRACHFATYASTCEEYHRMGYRTSGVYLVDVDSAGPMEATYVYCEMDKLHPGGVTVVEHNFIPNTTVRAPYLADRQYMLNYREMTREQLTLLTQSSKSCEQYLQYDCEESPISLSKKTWFKSTNGEIVDYIGSHNSGFCECPGEDGCHGRNCLCDHGESRSMSDNGYNRVRHQLPIMEMTFIQNSKGKGRMTLGPLKCRGIDKQPSDRSITFTKAGSFVRLNGWKSGDLKLNFKTHKKDALLLYQSSGAQEEEYTDDGISNENYFYIKLKSGNKVEFKFKVDGKSLYKSMISTTKLDGGDWHVIAIEYDKFNIRFSLDSKRNIIELPSDLDFPKFNGFLYLGGISDKLYKKSDETSVGFTGCMYGLNYNDEAVDLHSQVDHSMSGVSIDCMSSCWPNPCLNGGVCEEMWGDYTCICSDPWAHIGSDCQTDLNQDAVTLSGLPSSYLLFDVTTVRGILDGTIVISFRTFLNEAFLLYVHDEMGNFLQLEMSDSRTITVSFNNVNQIITDSVKADVALNDGEWRQVIAENYYNFTRLMVNGTSKVVEVRRGRITTYRLNPYFGSMNQQKTFIARPSVQPSPYVHAYVGGVKDEASSVSPLLGCVRGMRIGDHMFRLQDAASRLGNSTLVASACEKGCHENSCHHNGVCKEKWRDQQFECDCDVNGFSGFHCEIEPSISLGGNTVVMHRFQLPLLDQYSSTESLSFRFKADSTVYTNKPMAMVYVTSSQSNDYILVMLEPSGSLILETNQGVGIYRMQVSGRFSSGDSHDFSYVRHRYKMTVKVKPLDQYGNPIVDEIEEAESRHPDYPLNSIDTILIGGYINDGNSKQFPNLRNFTGCISNTAYRPKDTSSITLHTLRDLYLNVDDIDVLGDKGESCSTSQIQKVTSTEKPFETVTLGRFKDVTMPPWEKKDVRVVTLSSLPMQQTPSTTSSTTTTTVRSNDTFAGVLEEDHDPVEDLFIIIIVAAVTAVLIFFFCLLLIVARKKKKRNGDYEKKKEGEADMELRQPLNHTKGSYNHSSPHINNSSSPKRIIHILDDDVNSVNNDHLAKLDEFSMITALLGPRAPKIEPPPPDPTKQRYGKGNYPLTEEELEINCVNPIYNARKQRPASSISEVLEELERRQQPPDAPPQEPVKRSHGEGEMEWDPQADTSTPINYEDISFFNTPLLPPIPDELEESHLSSFSGQQSSFGDDSFQKADTLEGSCSLHGSTSHINSTAECNGDSGYEAESRPEVTEEDISPELNDDPDDIPNKLFSFHVPDLYPDSSPNLSGLSTKDDYLYEGTSV